MTNEVHTFDVHGLVVSSIDMGERDRLIQLLCSERGLITLSCPSARVLKSKLMAGTQLFIYGKFTCKEKGSKLSVVEVEIEESFYDLRSSISKAALASYFCELITFTGIEEPNTNLLRLTLNILYALSRNLESEGKLKGVFEWKMVDFLGVMPDLSGCFSCGKEHDTFLLNIQEGTILCRECQGKVSSTEQYYRDETLQASTIISDGVRSALLYLDTCPIEKIISFHLRDDDEKLFEKSGQDYITWHIDKVLPTLSFYLQVKD